MESMKRAIVIGASSGIGRELAKVLPLNNYIVGISSIAAIRGRAECPAYNASKAFVSNYMQGLRQKAANQIFNAIAGKKKHAYVTRRWRLAAC